MSAALFLKGNIMIRYLLNIFWVVTGRPNRVSEPYRPTLMIECNEWREERLVKRLRDSQYALNA